jgi:hypothetical protein
MNPKRLILAIVAVLVGLFATNYVIHEVWLKNVYQATASLWRTEAEMQKYFPWLLLGQIIWTIAFVTLWAQGFAARGCMRCACLFGLFMGLFNQANTLVTYAVSPLPSDLAVKWFVAGMVQGVLMGVLVALVYKPKSQAAAASVIAPDVSAAGPA